MVGVTVSWIPLAAGLHALLAQRAERLLGHGDRLPRARRLAPRARRGAVLLARRRPIRPPCRRRSWRAGRWRVLALFALTVGETDEAFANAYSGAVSLQNLFPAAPLPAPRRRHDRHSARWARWSIDLVSYQSFLLLLGSVFVPLFAVLLADWLVAGRRYTEDDLFRGADLAAGPDRRRGSAASPSTNGSRRRVPSWWVELRSRGSTHLTGASAPPSRASSSRSPWRSASRRPRDAPPRTPSAHETPSVNLVVHENCRRRTRMRTLQGSSRSRICSCRSSICGARVSGVAVIGSLTVDRVAGGAPRVGGAVYYAARAAARLRAGGRRRSRAARSRRATCLHAAGGARHPGHLAGRRDRPLRSPSTTRETTV